MSIIEIADCMKAGISNDASGDTIQKFFNACNQAAIDLGFQYFLDNGLTTYQAAMVIRAGIMELITQVGETSALALSRGYLIPDSPFPRLDTLNARRRLFSPLGTTTTEANQLFTNAVALAKMTRQYLDGKITFPRKASAQIEGYETSVDGISAQSGDPLADILGYQPDGDYVKRKRALDSLAKLDFSKRKPYLLFTAENPTGDGTVICWAKMRDASGYVITRRDVFPNVSAPEVFLSNDDARKVTDSLLNQEWFFQSLSFYDWIAPTDVLAFQDNSTTVNALYHYNVVGVQKKAPSSPFIFDTPSSAVLFNQQMVDATYQALSVEAQKFATEPGKVSPYPAISEAIYGDPSFGWIIAGCNILAAVRRGDSVDDVRAISYIGSTADRLITDGREGRLFVPNDIGEVQKAIENSIASYGVSQTVLTLLDSTGATHFISGKDDPNGLQPTQQSIERSTTGLARILSAIDPETATLDPQLLSTSPPASKILVSGKRYVSTFLTLGPTTPPFQEIIGNEIIDLTTYTGLGRLMALIRLIYDFYPGAFS